MLGNSQQAIEDFNKAIELKPDGADAYKNRGAVYNLLGNHQQAIKDFNKAIELKPDDALAYFIRGETYGGLGNHQQELKDYTKAIELQPVLAETYVHRGSAYFNLGSHQQAIKDFNKAIELKPDYADAYKGGARDTSRIYFPARSSSSTFSAKSILSNSGSQILEANSNRGLTSLDSVGGKSRCTLTVTNG